MATILSEQRNKWFVTKVREIEKTGITQAEVAKTIGVMPQYLTPIMSGKRNASEKLILKLCEMFDINQIDLYRTQPIDTQSDSEIAEQGEMVQRGEMVEYTHKPIELPAGACESCHLKDLQIKAANEYIDMLKERVLELKETISIYRQKVEVLEKK